MHERDAGDRSPVVRTDGGSPMPGVPPEDEPADEDPQPGTPTESAEPADTAGGSQMPGVPDSKGPEPAVKQNEGNTCGTSIEEDEETHDLTTAFTLNALASTANPAAVVEDARNWSDWVGVVGTVDSPTMNTFLRRNGVDIDFFNGANEPAERLARVAASGSAFHSDRLVLVGVEGEEGFVPEEDWEFELLEPTAAEAGWELQ